MPFIGPLYSQSWRPTGEQCLRCGAHDVWRSDERQQLWCKVCCQKVNLEDVYNARPLETVLNWLDKQVNKHVRKK